MGAGASVGHHASATGYTVDLSESGRIAVPSEVVVDPKWCSNFRVYIGHALRRICCSLYGNAAASKDLAAKYLDFWLDVSDYNLLEESQFKNMRRQEICEKYLAHGAESKIPLGSLLVEDILLQKFENEGSDTGASSNMFQAAHAEAFEYLRTEVLPYFVKNEGPYGMKQANRRILSRQSTRSFDVKYSPRQDDPNREELFVLLEDALATRFFKEFLEQRDEPEVLVFWLEAMDFQQRFEGVYTATAAAGGLEARAARHYQHFLVKANRIYDSCLKLGSTLRGSIDTDSLRMTVKKMSSKDRKHVTPDLFEQLADESFEIMLDDHFQAFLLSPEKHAFEMRVGARTARLRYIDEKHLESTEADRQELRDLLSANKTGAFRSYLHEVEQDNFLLFWQEIEDFKSIPHTQLTFLQGRAHKIFDKFLKRGAPMELRLDPIIRSSLIKYVDDADISLFNWAQEAAFEIMLTENFVAFKTTPYYDQQQREIEQAINGGPLPELPLLDILNNSQACAVFKKFAEAEFCVEPVLFWLDVEEYKRLPRSEFLELRMRKIMNRYIRVGALCPLDITPEARIATMEKTENPGPAAFQSAQNEITTFLETTLLPKFRKTEYYPVVVRTLAFDEMEKKAAAAAALNSTRDKSNSISGAPTDAATAASEARESFTDLNSYFTSTGELTIRDVLSSTTGVKFFKDFLISRHCEENLLFWLEAEDFKNIPGMDFMKICARKIAAKYIATTGRQQVNVDHHMRVELLAQLDSPSRAVFTKAQNEVLRIMTRDAWPYFVQSEQYKRYKELLETARDSGWTSFFRRSGPLAGAPNGGSFSNGYSGAGSMGMSQSSKTSWARRGNSESSFKRLPR